MVEQGLYREAMARLGAAVNIITTDGSAGRHGFTASAVCSVTDEPPTLLVCMNRNASAAGHFRENGVLAVNVLTGLHQDLSGLFAGRTKDMLERFAGAGWKTTKTGAPLLEDASVAFDCRISEIKDIGTHSVLFCEVEDVVMRGEPEALIYFQRNYHQLR